MKQRAIIPVLTPIAQQEIPAVKGDTAKLVAELQTFLPPERLVTKPDDLFAYECDAQTFDRAVPLAVAFPESTEEVSRIVQLCCTYTVPFVSMSDNGVSFTVRVWNGSAQVMSSPATLFVQSLVQKGKHKSKVSVPTNKVARARR